MLEMLSIVDLRFLLMVLLGSVPLKIPVWSVFENQIREAFPMT